MLVQAAGNYADSVPLSPVTASAHPGHRADALLTVVLVAATAAAILASSAFAGASAAAPDGTGSPWMVLRVVLAWGAGAGICTLVALRRRLPVVLVVAACLYTLVFPVDAVAALIGLATVIAHRPARDAWRAGAAVTVVTVVAVVRDAVRPPELQLFAPKSSAGAAGLPWWFYALVVVVALTAAVGAGLLRRSARAVGRIRTERDDVAARSEELRTELTRQEERDLLAREVHDTLAHRLSLVSLHAGALEVAAQADPQVRSVAEAVPTNAHRSLEDLRDLIGVLRDPTTSSQHASAAPDPSVTLADLPELLDASRRAGTRMVATVLVDDARLAGSALTLATYRIVQEALTNVHKHAPASEVDIRVTGGTDRGVSIVVRNALAAVPVAHVPGSGSGLTGIVERARLLGGSASAGPEGDTFVVDVHLPWVTRPQDDT